MPQATIWNPNIQGPSKKVIEVGTPMPAGYQLWTGGTATEAQAQAAIKAKVAPAPAAPTPPTTTLPAGMTQLTSPTQIANYDIKGQVGQAGQPGSYLYGIPKTVPQEAVAGEANDQMNAIIAEHNASIQQPEFQQFDTQGFANQLQNIIGQIQTASQPSEQTTALSQQATEGQAAIDQYDLQTAHNIRNLSYDPNITTRLAGGLMTREESEREFAKQSMMLNQKNILTQLGLSQEADQAALEAAKFGYTSLFDSANLLLKAQDAVNTQKQQIFDNAQKLNANAQLAFGKIMDLGLNPDKLSADQTFQLLSLAAQAGLPGDLMIAGMKNAYQQSVIDSTPIWSEPYNLGGDIVQKNTRTGEVRVAVNVPKGSGGGTSETKKKKQETEETTDKMAIQADVETIRGTDGYLDTAKYQQLREHIAATQSKYLSWFDDTYPPRLVLNPKDSTASKYFQTGTQAIAKDDEEKLRENMNNGYTRDQAKADGWPEALITKVYGEENKPWWKIW